MKNLLKWIFIIILLLVFFILNENNEKILKYFYKDTYREYVEQYSEKYNVDKNLIFAIIKAESNFDKEAKSDAGAIGLMQVMDSTAKDIAEKIEIEYNEEKLLDPQVNIEIGTKYISMLIEKYNNNELALAAYNAGSTNVDKWIQEGTLKDDGSNIENVPYSETNNYVRKSLRDYKIYNKLYKMEK